MGKMLIDFAKIKSEEMNPFWIFKKLNLVRPEVILENNKEHSANRIYEDANGDIVAIRCNCKRKTYHPVCNEKVNWDVEISSKDLPVCKKIGAEKLAWCLED